MQRLRLAKGDIEPLVAVRRFRWEFDDAIAGELAPDFIDKLELVLRLDDLKEFTAGRRWTSWVLELGRAHE